MIRKEIETIKNRIKLDMGPTVLSKTHYESYLSSGAKKSKEVLRILEPFDPLDVPPIEESNEPISIMPIEHERNRIATLFDSEPDSMKNEWKLYMSKAQLINAGSNQWLELEDYLLKIIGKLMNGLGKARRKIEEMERKRIEFQSSQINQYQVTHNDHSSVCQKFNKTHIVNPLNTTLHKRSSQKEFSVQNLNMNRKGNNKNNESVGCKNAKLKPLKTENINLTSICSPPNNQNNKSLALNQLVNSEYFLEISRLEKENTLYRQKIKEMEKESDKKLGQFKNRMEEEMKVKYNENLEKKHKYESELENKKFKNEILGREYQNLQTKYKKIEQEHELMTLELEKTRKENVKIEELARVKEMWLMQYEEIQTLQFTINKLLSEKESEMKKTLGLKQKLKELSKNYNYTFNASADLHKDKVDLTQILKEFRDWLKFIAVPRISKGMMNTNTFFPEMLVESPQNNYGLTLPKDDQSNYKILRPNFFIYFEAYEGIIMAQKKFPQRKILPPEFFLTIRAIFDAMFLHLTFTTDYKQWLNFPEFVTSYIDKFEISNETWKPRLRKVPIQSEEKINFLLNIFNGQAANSWECEIFRSFLMEDFTLDEIYFYLICRDRLLKGSQVNNNLGSGDPICYVRIETAEEVIKEKLKNYDVEMIQKIKSFIHSKKKVKNYIKSFIDVNFVLKLLLEVYSIEKIKSEKFFHQSFKSKSPNIKITYTEYSSFMEKNFEFLTKGDIAKLYRQIYTIGVGEITYKTIHFVCSIKGLFIPLVRYKFLNCLSHSESEQTHEEGQRRIMKRKEKQPKIFDDIVYLDLMNSVNKLSVGLEEWGMEDLLNINLDVNKFLHDNEKMKNYRSLFEIKLLAQTEKIIKIQALYRWKNSESLSLNLPVITNYEEISKDEQREKVSHLLALTHHTDNETMSMKRVKEVREKAMAKLTRNFKIRIQQSMAEFSIADKEACRNKMEGSHIREEAEQEEYEENGKKSES